MTEKCIWPMPSSPPDFACGYPLVAPGHRHCAEHATVLGTMPPPTTCQWFLPMDAGHCGRPLAPGDPRHCQEHAHAVAARRPAKFKRLALVLDIESVGLQGEGFAAGWTVVDLSKGGVELTLGAAWCDPESARGSKAGLEWVRANVTTPVMAHRFQSPRDVRGWFWEAWQQRRADHDLWADVPWPVEARFLADCVADGRDGERDMQGPYPLLDVATLVRATGQAPPDTISLAVPGEPHDPLHDARVSARKLAWALDRLGLRPS